ncbi:hypothetical protein HAX54_031660, partial [Datura stramonium]|nr:hypothetical protein [Datura stramonium]
ASINLVPLEIYKRSGLGMLRPINIGMQMVEKYIKKSVDIVEDVLVKVNDEEITFAVGKEVEIPKSYENISMSDDCKVDTDPKNQNQK